MRPILTTTGVLALAALLAAVPAARADEWDVGTDVDTDNVPATVNVLRHGSEQVHDMTGVATPAGDQDWYRLPAHPFSSYEFVLNGMTSDLNFSSTNVQRFLPGGTTPVQAADFLEGGGVLSMSWLGPVGTLFVEHFVRVQGPGCGAACDGNDRYRARFFDTTYTIPRFNNSGTQTTTLLLQNATYRGCSLTMYFLRQDGTLISASAPSTMSPYQLLVVPTANTLPNTSGTVRIGHTCGYGGLTGKAVAIEPSTGFTFDTALQHRP
jgi:hypothetical protein